MKKVFMVVLILSLLLTGSAYAMQSVDEVLSGDPVEINLVTIWGGPSADAEAVLAKINEILLEKANATLKFTYLDVPETQYPLLFAADEDYDLVFACDWWGYADYARKNAYLELTDEMIQTYMPLNWANMPSVAWDQSLIDGKLYLIPGNEVVFSARALVTRGDLREKYGLPELKTIEDLVTYCKTIAENETDMYPIAGDITEMLNYFWAATFPDSSYLLSGNMYASVFHDVDDHKVVNAFATDYYRQYAHMMKDLFDSGCWSSDAMSSGAILSDAFELGKSATYVHNLSSAGGIQSSVRKNNPEFNPELYDLLPNIAKAQSLYTGSGTAVNPKSENIEQALMVLDLMMNVPDLYRADKYGIEGKHWQTVNGEFVDRSLNEALPEDEKYSASTESWSFYNSNMKLKNISDTPEYLAMNEAFLDNVLDSPLTMFVADTSVYQNELAALSNIIEQYAKPINYGMVSDVDVAIDELLKMMDLAGIDTVMEGLQEQLDAFWAAR